MGSSPGLLKVKQKLRYLLFAAMLVASLLVLVAALLVSQRWWVIMTTTSEPAPIWALFFDSSFYVKLLSRR